MSHVPAPESTESDARPESGPVSDRDAQDAREAIYLSAVHSAYDTDTEVSTLEWDSRVAHLAMQAADAELAPLVARVAELEDKVRGFESRYEAAVTALERSRRLHVEAASEVERLQAALARVEELRAVSEVRPSRHYALEVRNAAGEVVEAICPACSDQVSEHWDNEDGSVVIGAGVPWSQCPASPVVAPSATDEDGA